MKKNVLKIQIQLTTISHYPIYINVYKFALRHTNTSIVRKELKKGWFTENLKIAGRSCDTRKTKIAKHTAFDVDLVLIVGT